MKNLSTWLLIIGLLGTIVSIYSMIAHQNIVDQIPFLICGVSLLWGYTEERKRELER